MKRIVSVATSLVAAAALVTAPAATAAPKRQTVEGSIAMRAPFTDLASCYSGAHRRLAVATQEQVNGVVGYHFDLDAATINKPFKLEVTGGQGAVDLDITFYADFGTIEQATDTGYAPYNMSYEKREPGGEKGVVPKETTKAIVCMFDGAGASFTYTAGKGVK